MLDPWSDRSIYGWSTAAGQIIALDGATGVEQWQVDIGGLPTGEMASTEGVIGVGTADRSVRHRSVYGDRALGV